MTDDAAHTTDPKRIGKILEIWRYPVSSLGGERIASSDIDESGIVNDRQYALVDAATGAPAKPENDARWRKALFLTAHHVADHHPILIFPDGSRCSVGDQNMDRLLSDYFGFPVITAAYDSAHALPGMALTRHRHHHAPLHLMTTASLSQLASIMLADSLDVRRFRPSVLIETDDAHGFVENEWVGCGARLGPTNVSIHEKTKRCAMTFISQPELPENAEILRNILRYNQRNLGVYGAVTRSGTITVGDTVSIASGSSG